MVKPAQQKAVFSEVGARIREERKKLGITQSAMAKLGGVSNATQGYYESGERSPNTEYLGRLYKEGVDVCYIVTGQKGAKSGMPANIDVELLSSIQEAVDEWDSKRTIPVRLKTKSELVALFYAQFAETGQANTEIMRRHLRLVK
ncbi:helix-turn-helix domain-containing protein [Thiolapillus sp.]|uniref:helix-turn-helix domain-containing protein n=1 Tax=Thiolapillus sp. TaxID=2017437 RepID=UPI003AF86FCE